MVVVANGLTYSCAISSSCCHPLRKERVGGFFTVGILKNYDIKQKDTKKYDYSFKFYCKKERGGEEGTVADDDLPPRPQEVTVDNEVGSLGGCACGVCVCTRFVQEKEREV